MIKLSKVSVDEIANLLEGIDIQGLGRPCDEVDIQFILKCTDDIREILGISTNHDWLTYESYQTRHEGLK